MNIASIITYKKIRIVSVLLCFVLVGFLCNAQDFNERGYWSELMRYDHLPIDSLWLFHPGNNLPSTDSNNNNWQVANTELLQNKNGKPLSMQGNGWYEKVVTIPDSLKNKPVAIRIAQFGASEIYLDGKLIQRYGIVGSAMENEKIYVPREPLIINLNSQANHKILIHYSNFHAANPGYANKRVGFRCIFSSPEIRLQSWIENSTALPVSIGIILIFCIYFFFVWLFYPKRFASLLTTLLLLNFCVVLTAVHFTLTLNEWEPLVWADNIGIITAQWLNYFLILILYALYYKGKMPRRTWLVIGGMSLCIFAVLNPRFTFLLGVLFVLVYFELARMFILGLKNKATGFWILLIGFLIQQAGLFLIVLDVFHWFPVYTPRLLLAQVIFPQLGIPLTYALQLAWEFRSANRDLRLQLMQVNELSEKSLVQEQEKQQLLATQNETLEKQVGERTSALTKSLSDLKSTQQQLIQSEKMASLGELTAGIAHEIQNPLNFVNNFSEVNQELISELVEEVDKGNTKEVKAIANDIKDNEEKINHHGKRADSIVKGMLQHSRQTSGMKEPADINALCDEYLRLSYHGLRAKDKNFNADFKTDFDASIGNINIISQDISRVLLNLYNNAFYAVNEKQKTYKVSKDLIGLEAYEPAVSVSTKKVGNSVTITVSDNGNGIPLSIKDKIFQPFFTTKPTGQGTGLGLSLSYDIVKAHGGELKVETKEGEGTEFIILLPLN